MRDYQPQNWASSALRVLLLLIALAIGARVVYGLLVPLLPGFIALLMVGLTYVLIFQQRHK